MGYQKIVVPADGDKITVNADLSLNVPNHPIIPFIEGDGIGVDITPAMKAVVDAAVQKLTVVNARSNGWKFIAAKKPTGFMALICQKKLLKLCVSLLFQLKVP